MNAHLLLLLSLVALPAMVRADDVDNLCKTTPHPDLCSSTIRADPKSQGATVPKMGIIIVDKVESNVKVADEKAKAAEQSATDPDIKSALGNSRKYYESILTGHVLASRESLAKGDYKYAVDYMTNAANLLGDCESWFPAGKSPASAENTAGKQLAEIATAIARGLLHG